MKMRTLPLLLQHYKNAGAVPKRMAAGFAGYLLFMKSVQTTDGRFLGEWEGETYEIKDDSAAWLQELWTHLSADEVADAVLSNETLWDADLSALPGFADAVKHYLNDFQHKGVLETIAELENLSVTN